MAKKIDAAENQKTRKILLIISIASNFGLLFYFKYLGFFMENLNLVLGQISEAKINYTNTILPIGLSFHTFQSVSYVIDIYRKKIKPENHLGIYSTYVLFFPQMVAGPIERFSTLGTELNNKTIFKIELIKKAIPLILIGLFYKMVIADNCGEYVNSTYSSLSNQNNYNVLLAIFLFCIQIYADFFGYSLIAQGSARLFGINLIDNFSFPFFSENIVVFWKKWHISLTSWFRDYVYIPLGGNKTNKIKHLFNILVVFVLSGLWHGAGFNFILWGAVHAIGYLITLAVINQLKIKLPSAISYIFNFVLVAFIFVFFRSGQLSESLAIFNNLFPKQENLDFIPISYFLLTNLFFLFLLEYAARTHDNYKAFIEQNNYFKNLLIYIYITFAILTFSGVDNLPFIYFQF